MNSDKTTSSEVTLCVPFYDLDPMQIVWHGNYFNYFELARVALFDSVGINLFDFYERHGVVFPVIRTSTKHIQPLRYRDRFVCRATLVEARNKLIVDFEIRRDGDGVLCARGRTEQVAVRAPEMEMLFVIPEEIRIALGCP
jgi:acyl-CoA thioester hydrolase